MRKTAFNFFAKLITYLKGKLCVTPSSLRENIERQVTLLTDLKNQKQKTHLAFSRTFCTKCRV